MGNTAVVGVGDVIVFDVAAAAVAVVVVAVRARGKHTNMFMTGTPGFWLGDLL